VAALPLNSLENMFIKIDPAPMMVKACGEDISK
jgi:hypothetical protein